MSEPTQLDLPGVADRRAEVSRRVLEAIAVGIRTRPTIAKRLGLEAREVANALQRLRRKRLIRCPNGRDWAVLP